MKSRYAYEGDIPINKRGVQKGVDGAFAYGLAQIEFRVNAEQAPLRMIIDSPDPVILQKFSYTFTTKVHLTKIVE